MSSISASDQTIPCAAPSRVEPATSSATPIAVETVKPTIECLRPGSSRLAIMNSHTCAARTTP